MLGIQDVFNKYFLKERYIKKEERKEGKEWRKCSLHDKEHLVSFTKQIQ